MADPISTKAIKLNTTLFKAPPVTAPKEEQTSLDSLLSSEKLEVKFSDNGANGAVLISSGTATSGGAAIKTENEFTGKRVVKVAQVMEDFFKEAEGNAPFIAPRIKRFTDKDIEGSPETLGKLKTLVKPPEDDEIKARQVNKFNTTLDTVAKGESFVLSMELAPGKTINKLDLEDKLALCKSDEFSRKIGYALPSMMALGLSDHLGAGDTMNFKNNVSNVMFDTTTGQLGVIDFDTMLTQDLASGGDFNRIRFGPKEGKEVMAELNNFLREHCSTPEKFEQAVEKLAKGEPSPLTGVMNAFIHQRDNETAMFSSGQDAQVKASISMEDRRRFAAGLLLGAVQGVEYVQKNEEHLRNAVKNSHDVIKVGEDEVKVEHYYTSTQMDEFCSEVNKLDTQALKLNIEKFSADLPKQRMDRLSQTIEGLNSEIETKQEQLKKLEGSFFKRMGAKRDGVTPSGLRSEIETLQSQLNDAHKSLNEIINREEIAKPMKQERLESLKESRVEELTLLANELGIDPKALELYEHNGEIRSPQRITDCVFAKELAANNYREVGADPETPQAEAKLSFMRANRDQALGQALRSVTSIMMKDGSKIQPDDLAKLKKELQLFKELATASDTEEKLQNEQRHTLYTSVLEETVKNTLTEQGFTPAEIKAYAEATVSLAGQIEGASLKNNLDMAKLYAEDIHKNLKSSDFKYSEYNTAANKVHDAVYKGYKGNVVEDKNGIKEVRGNNRAFSEKKANQCVESACMKHGIEVKQPLAVESKVEIPQPKPETVNIDEHKPSVRETLSSEKLKTSTSSSLEQKSPSLGSVKEKAKMFDELERKNKTSPPKINTFKN